MEADPVITKIGAIELLDKAILHIEEHGFDISCYGGVRCCYIGTLRRVAGYQNQCPSLDMSPELKTAFNVLDNLARDIAPAAFSDGTLDNLLGRYIESYGLYIRDKRSAQKYRGYYNSGEVVELLYEQETHEALNMLRKAKEVLSSQLADDDVIVRTNIERELVLA